jgi:glycosyltransferase involved in cell wall biosynthesis
MPLLSIAIPSKNEKFLEKTIRDILEKATGEIEVFPILDGYEPPPEEIVVDPRVKYVRLFPTVYSKKRFAINMINEISSGQYIMSCDAHCMFDKGFDEVLLYDIQDNWVVVPRRHRLDAENWSLQSQVDKRPPIDYEYLMWPKKFDPPAFHGFKWDEKTLAKKDVMIDDVIEIQGSCWVMSKNHFRKMGFMQTEGYQGWGQEGEEICMTTWFKGGRVVVNKNTWYAHLHKGPKYGRMYFLDRKESQRSYLYAYDLWANKRRGFFISLIEKFWPMPGWPENWKELL